MIWSLICNIDFILFVFPLISTAQRYSFHREDYDAFGDRLALNRNLTIIAMNEHTKFTIIENSLENHKRQCSVTYPTLMNKTLVITTLVYIHNIFLTTNHDIEHPAFVVLGEDRNKTLYLVVVGMTYPSVCTNSFYPIVWRPVKSYEEHETFAFGIDPLGRYACVVQFEETLCIDVTHDKSRRILNTVLWKGNSFLYSRSLIITEDLHLLLTAYRVVDREAKRLPYLYLSDISNLSFPKSLKMIRLSSQDFKWEIYAYTRFAILSMSFHEQLKMMIIGIPHLDTVVIASLKNNSLRLVKRHVSSQKNTFFGKAAVIIDSNMYAVLAYSSPILPWSLSHVQVYLMNEAEKTSKPHFVFPNNQQELKPANLQQLPHRIISLIGWGSHGIGLVLDAPSILLIPTSPPGFYSAPTEARDDITIYKSISCIPGTHQLNRSLGPCTLCPPGFKNNGSSGNSCVDCTTKNKLVCFGGAINEIDMSNVTNYDQANPYPESPHSTEFDDILLQNILQFSTRNIHCLLISPIFWTTIAIMLSLIIFITIKFISCRQKHRKRPQYFKRLLSHCDVIGEGRHWFGGLISFSLLVLIAFTGKFSVSFSYLYPIEEAPLEKRISVSCDEQLFNAKLTSSLQLLSSLKHQEEQPIFNLLDNQNITLTAQFISTGYTCADVTLQQNHDRGISVILKDFECSAHRGTLTVSKQLLKHIVTIQIVLDGPYFIGALRLCFSAPYAVDGSGYSKVQHMDTCKLFFVQNQTLTRNPTINVKMTKIINQTAGFRSQNQTTHTGLWLPSFVTDTLTDELLFAIEAEYLRYVPKQTTIVIAITESEFYMKNTQEPIARQYEIMFKAILFSMLCLDLFELQFLILKLTVLPLIRFGRKCFRKNTNTRMSRESSINSTVRKLGHAARKGYDINGRKQSRLPAICRY